VNFGGGGWWKDWRPKNKMKEGGSAAKRSGRVVVEKARGEEGREHRDGVSNAARNKGAGEKKGRQKGLICGGKLHFQTESGLL